MTSQATTTPPAKPPAGRWRRRLIRFGIHVTFALTIFALIEVYFRYVHSPSPGLTQFVFIHEMSAERWDYILDEQRSEEMLESIQEEIPTRYPNQQYLEEPEEDRPPWDRVMTPYHVATNASGFRDIPFPPAAKPAGVRRVLLLGDSITYGKALSVDERFADMLRARLGDDVQLMNLAYPACGSPCMLAFLKEFLAWRPDLVVVQPSGNDCDNAMARRALDGGATGAAPSLRWLLRSRAIQALAYALYADEKASQIDASVAAAAEHYGECLTELYDVCRQNGARAAVLSFPGTNGAWYGTHVEDACRENPDVCLGAIRLDLDHPERWLPGWATMPEATDDRMPKWLVETADRMDLEVETLAELFPYRRFFSDIVHPNRAANLIAASQLADFFANRWTPAR